MIAKYPSESDRAIARLTSLSKNTIAAAREAMNNSPEKRKADAFAKAWNALPDDQQVSLSWHTKPTSETFSQLSRVKLTG